MENIIISNPTSVSEAWEMICPGCRRDDELHVKATITVKLDRHGTDPIDSDTEWDNASIAYCDHCGHTATVKDFYEAFDKNNTIDS